MAKIPIHIITGFLGSGKTTFLAQLLQKQNHRNIALIINELGEIALDDSIISASYIQEKTLILNSGCMCCNRRDDLIEKLKDLLNAYEQQKQPLERVIIETTGLANPAPIIFTLLSDAFLANHFELVNTITCLDALSGISHIHENEEACHQILSSDCILITKTDLNPDTQVLREKIHSIHQGIPIFEKEHFDFSKLTQIKLQNPAPKDFALHKNLHNPSIQSLSLSFEKPLDWSAFSIWLSLLLHQYGSEILRVKGLLDIGEDFLVNINGVGHLIYPPAHLSSEQKSSHLVFIAKNLDLQKVLASFESFLAFHPSQIHIR